MSKPEITIVFDKQSVEVFYNNYGKIGKLHHELAYIDKHTRFEDVAQGIYEVCAALAVRVEVVKSDEFY